jgi:hypothetical protein
MQGHNHAKGRRKDIVMTLPMRPKPPHDPWVDLIRGYITGTVQALQQGGLIVERAWLDPSDPRDATIVLRDAPALVWDEQAGWREGGFVSGEQGVRTVLDSPSLLGGGVLPDPRRLAGAVRAGIALSPAPAAYRSYTDRDGLDDTLLQWRT